MKRPKKEDYVYEYKYSEAQDKYIDYLESEEYRDKIISEMWDSFNKPFQMKDDSETLENTKA